MYVEYKKFSDQTIAYFPGAPDRGHVIFISELLLLTYNLEKVMLTALTEIELNFDWFKSEPLISTQC
jgi:hypothetical protein